MPPPGSIIVKLQRPLSRLDTEIARLFPADGPWLLQDQHAVVDAITPTAELEAMMPGRQGWFYARRTERGWDIIAPAPDQPW
ncbi:MAG TPA: hypothetical protein VHZ26_09090 [Caulobacteraceae bacterium]|jgi:hypothetical protein|nr:hypothetical protein [Caulobacteraceae bacterium]